MSPTSNELSNKVMSYAFFVKFRVFKRGFLQKQQYIGLKFSEITEIVMLFNIQGFILLASSDKDEHMFMRQKM